jgi:amino acid permease
MNMYFKKDLSSIFKVAQLTMENGLPLTSMVMVSRYGLMELNTSANGKAIKLMVLANLSTLMEIYTKDFGKTIK